MLQEKYLIASLLLELNNDLFVAVDGDAHDHVHLVSLTTFVCTSLHEAKLILVVV